MLRCRTALLAGSIALPLTAAILLGPLLAAAQGVAPDPSLIEPAPAMESAPAAMETGAAPPAYEEAPIVEGDIGGDFHEGFFFRLMLGLGWGWIGSGGTLPPAKGLRIVEDFSHDSPVFNFSLSLGGGFLGLAIHVGVLYERMFMRSDDPVEIGVTLMGVGGGLSYYFTEYDFFATAEARLTGMMTFMPQVVCEDYYADKFEWYRGPGFSLTLGKEWYDDEPDESGEEDEGGIGLGIQGNYARMTDRDGDNLAINYFSVLLVLTVSHF